VRRGVSGCLPAAGPPNLFLKEQLRELVQIRAPVVKSVASAGELCGKLDPF